MKTTIITLVALIAIIAGLSAQSIDSVKNGVPAASQTTAKVGGWYYGAAGASSFFYRINYGPEDSVNAKNSGNYGVGAGTDSITSVILTGLQPGIKYKYQIFFFYPVVKAGPVDSFTTSTCSFTLTASSSADTICGGNSVVLTASGASAYAWSPTTGLSNPNVAAPVATPSTTTTYTVTGTAGGCSNTASVKIVVGGTAASITTDKDSICVDAVENILLTGSPVGGVFSGSGVVGNVFYPSLVGAGTYAVSYDYDDGSGCASSASKYVYVLDVPNVTGWYYSGKTLELYGNFAYPVKVSIGSSNYVATVQNVNLAIFNNVTLNDGDMVLVQSTNGGCFTYFIATFTGIKEVAGINNKKGKEDNRTFNVLGQEIPNVKLPPGIYVRGGKKFVVTEQR